MSKADIIEVEGVVVKAKNGAKFDVQIENGAIIDCALSGKLRQNKIMIVLGDKVKIEISPYDLTRGRISWRDRT